jgi:hypothetical protein
MVAPRRSVDDRFPGTAWYSGGLVTTPQPPGSSLRLPTHVYILGDNLRPPPRAAEPPPLPQPMDPLPLPDDQVAQTDDELVDELEEIIDDDPQDVLPPPTTPESPEEPEPPAPSPIPREPPPPPREREPDSIVVSAAVPADFGLPQPRDSSQTRFAGLLRRLTLVDPIEEACNRTGVLGRQEGETVDDCIERTRDEQDMIGGIIGAIFGGRRPLRRLIPRRIPGRPRRRRAVPERIPSRPFRRRPGRMPQPLPGRGPVPVPLPPTPSTPAQTLPTPPLPPFGPPPLPPFETTPPRLPEPEQRDLEVDPDAISIPDRTDTFGTPSSESFGDPVADPDSASEAGDQGTEAAPEASPRAVPVAAAIAGAIAAAALAGLGLRTNPNPSPATSPQPAPAAAAAAAAPPATSALPGLTAFSPQVANLCQICRDDERKKRKKRQEQCKAFIKIPVRAHSRKICASDLPKYVARNLRAAAKRELVALGVPAQLLQKPRLRKPRLPDIRIPGSPSWPRGIKIDLGDAFQTGSRR